MTMNPNLDRLQRYPFERLNALLADVTPPALAPVNLGIGEPKHAPPAFIGDTLAASLDGLGRYAGTGGTPELRNTLCRWLERRFALGDGALDPDANVLPAAGTREALFAITQAVAAGRPDALVLMPNPCYQIYEGAALLAGAEPIYLNTIADTGYLPDLDAVPESTWRQCAVIYICSPGNPSGAVLPEAWLRKLIALADAHDFVIAADECYSELYPDEERPPLGLLEVCARMGRTGFHRCVVFHSLSKRSNVPGLRSGFVAGDADILEGFLRYRTYQGCALPLHVQQASRAAWDDEAHVRHNRSRYRAKFDTALAILRPVLDVDMPDAGFYLWPRTPVDDVTFARTLYEQENVRVLPGSYLSREANGINPGAGHVRMALVADEAECEEAMRRIRRCVERL